MNMVNFNSDGAFTTNKGHILELVILGRRDELLNAFQLWNESYVSNSSREELHRSKLRAVLFSLFLEIERPLFRKLSSSDYTLIHDTLTARDMLSASDLVKIYMLINTALDDLNLIKIDNKRSYDSTNVEVENFEKGL